MNADIVSVFGAWSLLIAFALHDGEEVLTIGWWMRTIERRGWTSRRPPFVDLDKSITGQFAIAVVFLGVAVCSVLAVSESVNHIMGVYLWVGCACVMYLDAVKHVLISLLYRHYTPGIVTAVIVELPYAGYVIHRAITLHAVPWATIFEYTAISLVFVGGFVVLGFFLGRALMPRKKSFDAEFRGFI